MLGYLKLAIAYVRLNLNAQLEYRGAFISQIIAMLLNVPTERLQVTFATPPRSLNSPLHCVCTPMLGVI
jgi:ABC-type uncharacterized transport system permease subunit